MNPPRKILIIRNDRLGDLVLTTPALAALRQHRPRARIELLCSAYAEPVVRENPHLDDVLTGLSAHDSSDLGELRRLVRSRRYDCVAAMVHSLKNCRLARATGSRIRIGPLVKWYSPLFFSTAIRQQRSSAEKSEARYNLELLAPLGVPGDILPQPVVRPTAQGKERGAEFVESAFPGGDERPLAVVHPGMGGSALNWPEERYAELVRLLDESGRFRVAVTGSEAEEELARRVAAGSGARVISGAGLEDFIGILAHAHAVCAPSTGPLHLAAALGVPRVAGLYAPVRVMHPRRWGPLGTGEIRVFLPEADCPSTTDCKREKCMNYFCMAGIGAGEVAGWLLR